MSHNPPAPPDRVYALLLALYPGEFRREYGPHMAQTFRDLQRGAWRQAGWIGVGRVWLETLADLTVTVIKERMLIMRRELSVPTLFGAGLLVIPLIFIATQVMIHELGIGGIADPFDAIYQTASPVLARLMDAVIFLGPLAAVVLTAIPFLRRHVQWRPQPGTVAVVTITPGGLVMLAVLVVGGLLALAFTSYIIGENWQCWIGAQASC